MLTTTEQMQLIKDIEHMERAGCDPIFMGYTLQQPVTTIIAMIEHRDEAVHNRAMAVHNWAMAALDRMSESMEVDDA